MTDVSKKSPVSHLKPSAILIFNLLYGLFGHGKSSIKQIIQRVFIKFLPGPLRKTIVLYAKGKSQIPRQTRRFLHPKLSLIQFFEELKQRDIQYVVIRWFEQLPQVAPNEDIDILIADSDLDKVNDLFGLNAWKQKFDIYSVSGLSGSNYKGIPYFPPVCAREVLENRKLLKGSFFIPDAKHYFLSLTYHAVFHKGDRSGLSFKQAPVFENPDHDYAALLQKAARNSGFDTEGYDYSSYFQLLREEGWLPGIDTLRKLAVGNPWLRKKLPAFSDDECNNDMLLFVIREWAIVHNKLDSIIHQLKAKKLDIVFTRLLNDEEKKNARTLLRGGKWDKGPFPKDGGYPAAFVLCYDYHPVCPTGKDLEHHPFIENRNILIKHKIRNKINNEQLVFKHSNFIHSADDNLEAWDYIRKVIPNEETKIKELVNDCRKSFKTTFPVYQVFETKRNRAKVEKIDYHGQPAIKKTYRMGQERFLENEVFACTELRKNIKPIPELLEHGKNYVIFKWYQNKLIGLSKSKKSRLLRQYGKEIVDFAKELYYLGYAFMDFHPGNVMITDSNELMFIDFEFLYAYVTKPDSFYESYDIKGIPNDFKGDRPKGQNCSYDRCWKPILGPLNRLI